MSWREEQKVVISICFGTFNTIRAFSGGSVVKNLPANAGDMGWIPGSGRSPGEKNGNPLQYSCLENPMDGGTWLGYSPWVSNNQI